MQILLYTDKDQFRLLDLALLWVRDNNLSEPQLSNEIEAFRRMLALPCRQQSRLENMVMCWYRKLCAKVVEHFSDKFVPHKDKLVNDLVMVRKSDIEREILGRVFDHHFDGPGPLPHGKSMEEVLEQHRVELSAREVQPLMQITPIWNFNSLVISLEQAYFLADHLGVMPVCLPPLHPTLEENMKSYWDRRHVFRLIELAFLLCNETPPRCVDLGQLPEKVYKMLYLLKEKVAHGVLLPMKSFSVLQPIPDLAMQPVNRVAIAQFLQQENIDKHPVFYPHYRGIDADANPMEELVGLGKSASDAERENRKRKVEKAVQVINDVDIRINGKRYELSKVKVECIKAIMELYIQKEKFTEDEIKARIGGRSPTTRLSDIIGEEMYKLLIEADGTGYRRLKI